MANGRYDSGGFSNPFQNISAPVSSILQGALIDQGSPYNQAREPYNQYMGQAANVQNPFYRAGTSAIPQYQQWLQGQQDPSAFINHLMSQYQESPFAQYQQQQARRQAINLGSATGLTGSSPMQLQAQQNAQNISSQDMNQWLANVLGINSNYGSGLSNLMGSGQNAANQLSGIYGNQAQGLGNLAYGQQAAQNQGWENIIGGLASFL